MLFPCIIMDIYRENIYEVIEGTRERITTLVVPKNTGLNSYAWKVLGEAGLTVNKAREIGQNKLKVGNLTLLVRRGEDIPQIVMDEHRRGVVVLGLTGDDLFDEYQLRNPKNPLKIENTYDWFDPAAKFFRPTLCLINRSGRVNDIPLEARVAVNQKYRETCSYYLAKAPQVRDKTFYTTLYSGDVEGNVAVGINDCGIEIVYTGDTLDATRPRLKIAGIVRFTDLVVISPLKR